MVDPTWDEIKDVLTKFLTERLELFYSVRESFYIDDELGLGSIPRFHFPNSWLRVIPLVRPSRILLRSSQRRISLRKEGALVIVEPEDSLLSVYPRTTSIRSDGGIFDKRFLNISDDALMGGYAHECAAYQIYKKRVPRRFIHTLEGIDNKQKLEDALAAAYGYRDGVIRLLETHLKLLVYEPKPQYGWFIRGSLSIKDELEDRIAFLKDMAL